MDCPNNDWWAVNNEQDSPAGKYLDGPTLYDDCVAGFNAALGGCKLFIVHFLKYLLTMSKVKLQAILMERRTHINAWSIFCFLRVHQICSCLATTFRGNIRRLALLRWACLEISAKYMAYSHRCRGFELLFLFWFSVV